MFKCVMMNKCRYGKKDGSPECKTCVRNTLRNYGEDYYIKANDAPIPEERPKIKPYEGSEKQTRGYLCPICKQYTNRYQLWGGKNCAYCGYQLLE